MPTSFTALVFISKWSTFQDFATEFFQIKERTHAFPIHYNYHSQAESRTHDLSPEEVCSQSFPTQKPPL